MVPTSPYSEEEDTWVPPQPQLQNNAWRNHLHLPHPLSDRWVLSVIEKWKVWKENIPHPTQVVATWGCCWAGRAETGRDPWEPLLGHEWRSLPEAEGWEPVGSRVEGERGWPRSNLVWSTAALGVHGHRGNNIRSARAPWQWMASLLSQAPFLLFQRKEGSSFSAFTAGGQHSCTWDCTLVTPWPCTFPFPWGLDPSTVVPHPPCWSLSILTSHPLDPYY